MSVYLILIISVLVLNNVMLFSLSFKLLETHVLAQSINLYFYETWSLHFYVDSHRYPIKNFFPSNFNWSYVNYLTSLRRAQSGMESFFSSPVEFRSGKPDLNSDQI